jgi:hypothetical protein
MSDLWKNLKHLMHRNVWLFTRPRAIQQAQAQWLSGRKTTCVRGLGGYDELLLSAGTYLQNNLFEQE